MIVSKDLVLGRYLYYLIVSSLQYWKESRSSNYYNTQPRHCWKLLKLNYSIDRLGEIALRPISLQNPNQYFNLGSYDCSQVFTFYSHVRAYLADQWNKVSDVHFFSYNLSIFNHNHVNHLINWHIVVDVIVLCCIKIFLILNSNVSIEQSVFN